MEALREAKAVLTVYVHPSNAADIRRAVARQLSTLLFLYEDRFDGVLLAHEVLVNGKRAKILNGLVPYFGVPVDAHLLLYSPQPDMIIGDGGKFISRSDKHHVIKNGRMIRFSVKRVDTEMNCHITGSLIPPHTGSMSWLSIHDAEYASQINSGKMISSNIGIKIEKNEQDQRTLDDEDGVINSERSHKKSRKRALEE